MTNRRENDRQLIDLIGKSGFLGAGVKWLRGTAQAAALFNIGGRASFNIGGRASFSPQLHLENGRRLPHWEELTHWGKLQLAILKMSLTRCLTVEAKLHPTKARQWIGEGWDIRQTIRRRLRDQLAGTSYSNLPYVLVIEGRDQTGRIPTLLHVHGAVESVDADTDAAFTTALRKAMGYFDAKQVTKDKAYHQEVFYGGGTRFSNYIFKNAHRKDERLLERRLIFSRTATQSVRGFYKTVIENLGKGISQNFDSAANDNARISSIAA